MSARDAFTREEGGFTTPAAAVAILLVCALVFMCLDGYRTAGRSGQIQYVADAGALAADGAVAEYVTAGQAVDAVLLSLSLLGVSAYAASAVASFVPGGAGAASRLASAGRGVLKARDRFASSAEKGLAAAQKALPALCAVRAAKVVRANAEASGKEYVGIAIANPMRGAKVELADGTASREAAEGIEKEEGKVQEASRKRERAQRDLENAKERAWRADCGSTGMSMRERAGHLAGLSGRANPSYATSDTWRFSVPLARARAYYRARYAQEPAESASGNPEEVGKSIARKRFYLYARREVSKGHVGRSPSGTELPDLKELPRNTEQVRSTWLYTESRYPLSRRGGRLVLHAWRGCPGYGSGKAAGRGSVADIDAGRCARCETCRFAASTLGRVPAASTSIDNGFEYYYRLVVEASREYREAANEAEALRSELEGSRKRMARGVLEAFKSLKGARYDPQPPGRYGCVCIVFAPEEGPSKLPFLKQGARTPARIALSGATLAPDGASDEGTVISGIAEGLVPAGGLGSGLTRTVLSTWGKALKAHSDGNEAVVAAFDAVLSKIPLVGNDLSEWAAASFRDAVAQAGLEPADLKTYKPVLVNTSQVMARGDGKAAEALERLKRASELFAAGEAADWGAVADVLGDCPDLAGSLSGEGLRVAELALPGSGARGGSLRISAPADLAGEYAAAVDAVRSFAGGR